MADIRITNVPTTSAISDDDYLYIRTGDNFRRVLVSALMTALESAGFITTDDGISLTDIANQGIANANKILCVGSDGSITLSPAAKILTMQESGNAYTFTGANFSFDTLADLQALVSSGTILWLINTNTGSAYQSVNSRGTGSTARLTFAGPTLESDNDDLSVEAFILDGSMDITRKVMSGSGGGVVPAPGVGDEGKVPMVVSGVVVWAAISETTTSEIDAIIAAI